MCIVHKNYLKITYNFISFTYASSSASSSSADTGFAGRAAAGRFPPRFGGPKVKEMAKFEIFI